MGEASFIGKLPSKIYYDYGQQFCQCRLEKREQFSFGASFKSSIPSNAKRSGVCIEAAS